MSEDRPDVVLVTADSIRGDYCGFLDGDRELTPFLNSLAEDSLVFENAISPGPRTPSSMPSIVTGRPRAPVNHTRQDWHKRWDSIEAHLRAYGTVTEAFRERGYTTIGLTTNPWTTDTGFERGFDQFLTLDDIFERTSPSGSLLWRLERLMRESGIGDYFGFVDKRQWFLKWEDYYDLLLEALESVESPYFLWVFLLDTHQPYLASRQFREENSMAGMYYAITREFLADDPAALSPSVMRRLEGAYRDTVRSVDGFVHRLVGSGHLDDAVLVFHSDHGEAFGEHGSYGHQSRLYRENVRVPLLVNGPSVPDGRVSDPVSLCTLPGIMTTLADGRQLAPDSLPSEFVVSASEFGEADCVYGHGWKLVRSERGRELYNVTSDPAEHNDLSSELPVVTDTLDGALERSRAPVRERAAIRDALDETEAIL